MAVLILTKVKNQTQEGYDSVLAAVKESMQKSPGFVMHYAYPGDGEWEVAELWNSKKQADEYFAKYIAPNIPKGVVPKRTYRELYSLLTPAESNVNEAALS